MSCRQTVCPRLQRGVAAMSKHSGSSERPIVALAHAQPSANPAAQAAGDPLRQAGVAAPAQQQQQSQPEQQQQGLAQRLSEQDGRRRPTQGQLVERCMVPGPPTVDVGANLVDKSFDKDRRAVLMRAAQAGIASLVVTGTCTRTAAAAAELCNLHAGQQPDLRFTAGVHPHNAKRCNDGTIQQLRQLASHDRCVAIGECGLDFNRNFSPPEVQERWFAAQVELAEELQLSLFMHCRDAAPRFADILRAHRRSVPGVVHCFTGSRQELQAFLDMGLHIGITGWVCDDRPDRGGAELAALLPLIPDDRLMIETDCPYLTPRSIQPSKARPQRNEPALLPHVLHAVAAARGDTVERVAHLTTRNARAFFRLP